MSVLRRLALMVSVMVLTISIGASVFVQAQGNEGASGLSISPTRKELTIEPGKTDVVKISLRNVSGTDINAKAFINDFESSSTGEPRIIVDPTKQNAASIRSFLSGVTDIQLKKDEKKELEIPVAVPANAAPGAYYGIIRYAAIPAGRGAPEDGQVALTASVGTLVLIEVPGDIKEQIQVQSLKVLKDNKSSSFFVNSPNRVALTIKNNGNSFSKPFGKVNVSNMSGKEVHSYELNNTDPRGNILPAGTRIFTDDLKNIKTPGRYTVTANISHGRGGEVITYKSAFWYIPTYLLVLLGLLLLAIATIGYLAYRRLSRRPAKKRRK